MRKHRIKRSAWLKKAKLSRNALYHLYKGRAVSLTTTTLKKLADALGEESGAFLAFAQPDPTTLSVVSAAVLEKILSEALERIPQSVPREELPRLLAGELRIALADREPEQPKPAIHSGRLASSRAIAQPHPNTKRTARP